MNPLDLYLLSKHADAPQAGGWGPTLRNAAIQTGVGLAVAGAPLAASHVYNAVTKRHQLMASGWPPRSLLLAEVITHWGEHHLVVVVRTQSADLVIDNLNANIKPWTRTNYTWVRIQTPNNPMFWAKVGERSV